MSSRGGILLVDIGNTRIKWARYAHGRLGRQRAAAHAGWSSEDFSRQVLAVNRGIGRIVVASVAGQRIDQSFVSAAKNSCRIAPQFIKTARRAAGVTTLYEEPWRLGVDRFVAAIGAHHLARGAAVCVVDIGTAMTIDLIDSRGRHRGGAIVPGPDLMVVSLLKDTSGIAKRARGRATGRSLFARNTRAAIEQGAYHAAAAVIDHAMASAAEALGARPRLMLTGGALPSIRRGIRSKHFVVPDLVLRGLAVLAADAPARNQEE